TYFPLKLVSKSDLPVNIKVVDAAGRLVEAKAKQAANSTLQLGHNYATGNYFAEFIQGNQRKVVQLMKIK
ncbi:MAG: T9SS type A sorting domain-containing protein, partial [Sediminibacterium sp.]